MNSKIKIAMEEANKSTYIYKVGAVIFNKKKIISVGHNSASRSLKSFNREYIKFKNSIHAEISSIIRARTDLKGSSILVVKINNSGELSMAKPCNYCLSYIKFVKIKNVYFSNRIGEIERL
uniref:Putative CMP/dCMP deaminase zinc-binding n=1 Tax=viral metagenome TaxID=1070528 RepID=A0A6H1ZZ94_9ZZZZ